MPDLIIGTNTYVDLIAADAHFDARLHAGAWINATEDTRKKSLLMAALLLDRHITWLGSKAFPEQALEWPRVGISWVPAGSVPPSVKTAQMELALILIERDTTALNALAGMSEVTVDALKIKVNPSDRVKPVPRQVADLVRAYGSPAGGLTSITLTR